MRPERNTDRGELLLARICRQANRKVRSTFRGRHPPCVFVCCVYILHSTYIASARSQELARVLFVQHTTSRKSAKVSTLLYILLAHYHKFTSSCAQPARADIHGWNWLALFYCKDALWLCLALRGIILLLTHIMSIKHANNNTFIFN